MRVITVVVPTHNPSGEALERAVRSVRMHLPEANVIVVDDGSEPPANVEGADVMTRTTGLGPGGARNHGALLATGEWLIFLDDDDELLQGAAKFTEAVAGAEPGVGLICAAAIIRRSGRESLGLPQPVEGLADKPQLSSLAGSFAVSKRLFTQVGGYDDELRFGENTDVIIRCAAATSVRTLSVPTVMYNAAIDERRYDERRFRSVERLLERGRPDLEHRGTRSKFHGIAAVNAARIGYHRLSVRHAWRSFTARPDGRTLARLIATFGGPASRLWWRRGTPGS